MFSSFQLNMWQKLVEKYKGYIKNTNILNNSLCTLNRGDRALVRKLHRKNSLAYVFYPESFHVVQDDFPPSEPENK